MSTDFGHVKISRKAYATDPFWNEPREFSKWEAWEWIIQEGSWKDRRRVIGMKVIPLARGELLASIRFMGEAWGWKRSRVHDFIRLLVEMGRIAGQRETPEGVVYLIVNYEQYQNAGDTDRTGGRTGKRTRKRTQSGQRADSERTNEKQLKQGKHGGGSARTRGALHALPDDWQPNAKHVALALELGVDLRLEAEKMRDWAAGEGAMKRDWDRTFNNWLRRAEPIRRNGNGRSSRSSQQSEEWDPEAEVYV